MQDRPNITPHGGIASTSPAAPLKYSSTLREATDRTLARLSEVRSIIERGKPSSEPPAAPLAPDPMLAPDPALAATAPIPVEGIAAGQPESPPARLPALRTRRRPSTRTTLAVTAILAVALLLLIRLLAGRRK